MTRVSPILSDAEEGVYIQVRAKPKASENKVGPVRGGAIEVSVRAQPEGNKANEAIGALLAEKLGIAKSLVSLVSGPSSRTKTFFAFGMSADTARTRLGL